MNSRTLKKHLKYIVPEMRLALIKEPGTNPLPVNCPEDLDKFVEPLRHYSEEYFIAWGLLKLTGSIRGMRIWLNAQIVELDNELPIDFIKDGHVEDIAAMVEDALLGHPS